MEKVSTVSETITAFLKQVPINFAKDLTSRFHVGMEAQVNINPSHGEPVYEGTRRIKNTYQVVSEQFGTYKFFPIRIPYQSMTDPHYSDPPMAYPLDVHIEGIGMTGWCWQKKQPLWVGFDFDSITDHSSGVGITEEKMQKVKDMACQIPWVQVRKSTGGNGIHLYVFLDPENEYEVPNHDVHSALGKAILGMMSREVGFDFRANSDCLGGNMWIWHRKISNHNRGLEIIKDFEGFCPDLPSNWLDNLDVIKGRSSTIRVRGASEGFESKAASRTKIKIDDVHKQIEDRIANLDYSIIWVPDHHCWHTHSKAFQDLHEEFPGEYKGYFKTLSQGTDKHEPNSFAFPLPDGGMRIIRFQKGTREHESWFTGGDGWTSTFFNVTPSLREVSSMFDGIQDPDGKGWVFSKLEDVSLTLNAMGEDLPLTDTWLEMFGGEDRNIILRSNKNNQLVIEMDKNKDNKIPKNWMAKGRKFIKLFANTTPEPVRDDDNAEVDDRVRALVDLNNEFSSWCLLNDKHEWVIQPKDNIRSALKVLALDDGEQLLGKLVIKNWKIVNIPFQPEYLGNREWNRNAPQFAVAPAEHGTPHLHWDLILNHCGQDLDYPVQQNAWCKEFGINSGADYLLHWIAFMIREPYKKLPYLFFYGPQNSGKSILHEAISKLMTRGVVVAKESLESNSGFNGELAGAVLCVVEESNLSSKRSTVYNRMKDWSVAENILIHTKGQTPYMLRNSTHWMQIGNDRSYVPIFPGDSRVVILYVPYPDGQEIPRDNLHVKLAEEAPAFLRTVLDLRLPPAPGRMRLPVLSTDSKKEAEEDSESAVDSFISQQCHVIPGAYIKLTDFYNALKDWVSEDQKFIWTKNKVTNELRTRSFNGIVFGRAFNNQMFLGNLSLEPINTEVEYGERWIKNGQKINREK